MLDGQAIHLWISPEGDDGLEVIVEIEREGGSKQFSARLDDLLLRSYRAKGLSFIVEQGEIVPHPNEAHRED